MKLLLDQNISFKLVPILDVAFPGSKHVSDFGLTGDDDEAIWTCALNNDFAILSKDSDFFHRSILRGHPPKVIQLRVGNCSTQFISKLLDREESVIKTFLSASREALLILE